ncbi:MAG: hypothetical protein HIU93_13145 [Acidobacteria bacterium]|nr:hypothetical protein [Acidobacteriota bacterium]MBW4045436.1 hypothetical protein [Acidobacteriota bacterium]
MDDRGGYHGYAATDQYAVDPHFGSLAELQELANALHARGMKLVLDTVPNHVGPHHPWVHDEPRQTGFTEHWRTTSPRASTFPCSSIHTHPSVIATQYCTAGLPILFQT